MFAKNNNIKIAANQDKNNKNKPTVPVLFYKNFVEGQNHRGLSILEK